MQPPALQSRGFPAIPGRGCPRVCLTTRDRTLRVGRSNALALDEEVTMDPAATLGEMYERINAHDIPGFLAYLADDFVEHDELPPGLPPGKEGVGQFFAIYMAAFPDLHFNAEEIMTSGDKAIGRLRCTGTNTGDFVGMPATGKSAVVKGIDIIRFGDDGLAREHWSVFDMLGLMQQLGVVPRPDSAPAVA